VSSVVGKPTSAKHRFRTTPRMIVAGSCFSPPIRTFQDGGLKGSRGQPSASSGKRWSTMGVPIVSSSTAAGPTREAIVSCDTTNQLQDRCRRRLKPIRIRQSQYLNNRIEQDLRGSSAVLGRCSASNLPLPPASFSKVSKWFRRCANGRQGTPSIPIHRWPSSSTSSPPHKHRPPSHLASAQQKFAAEPVRLVPFQPGI